MNDYLNNLVARALNSAPVVQPRLPSLFERPATMTTAPITHETLSEESSPVSQAAPISSRPTLEVPFVMPQPGEKPEVKREAFSPAARSNSKIFDWPEQAANRPPQAFSPTPTPLVGPSPDTVSPSLSMSESFPVQIAFSGRREHKTLATDPDPTSISITTEGRELEESRPTLEPRVRRIVNELFDDRPASGKNREPSASFGVTSPRRGITQHPEQPQTINVTIGRVDVRAIFPQPAAPRSKHARPSAAMSLDEYLERGSEGHR